jgi:hypothetical protein
MTQTKTICTIEGCKARATAKGLCSRHYMRARRHGDPNQVNPPGARRNVELNTWKVELRKVQPLMSERTFHRYFSAIRGLQWGATEEVIEEMVTEATRSSGSFNVSRFKALADEWVKKSIKQSVKQAGRNPRVNLALLRIADEADRLNIERRPLLKKLFKRVHGRDATEDDVARYETQIRRLRLKRTRHSE